ncbi:hypothetical protein EIN_516680, partial [Entamoeba invadens IP1]
LSEDSTWCSQHIEAVPTWCPTRWLSQGKIVFFRLSEMEKEIVFIGDVEKSELTTFFRDNANYVVSSYLVDTLNTLCDLNQSLQGTNAFMFHEMGVIRNFYMELRNKVVKISQYNFSSFETIKDLKFEPDCFIHDFIDIILTIIYGMEFRFPYVKCSSFDHCLEMKFSEIEQKSLFALFFEEYVETSKMLPKEYTQFKDDIDIIKKIRNTKVVDVKNVNGFPDLLAYKDMINRNGELWKFTLYIMSIFPTSVISESTFSIAKYTWRPNIKQNTFNLRKSLVFVEFFLLERENWIFSIQIFL